MIDHKKHAVRIQLSTEARRLGRALAALSEQSLSDLIEAMLLETAKASGLGQKSPAYLENRFRPKAQYVLDQPITGPPKKKCRRCEKEILVWGAGICPPCVEEVKEEEVRSCNMCRREVVGGASVCNDCFHHLGEKS